LQQGAASAQQEAPSVQQLAPDPQQAAPSTQHAAPGVQQELFAFGAGAVANDADTAHAIAANAMIDLRIIKTFLKIC